MVSAKGFGLDKVVTSILASVDTSNWGPVECLMNSILATCSLRLCGCTSQIEIRHTAFVRPS